MNPVEPEGWTELEAPALRAIAPPEHPVPAVLKSRLVERLTGLGLVTSTIPGRRSWAPWAAAAVLAVGGFGLGRASSSSPLPSETGQRYVLLLNGAASATPAENAARRKEYGDWLNDLRRRGLGVDGAELVGTQHELPAPRSGPPVVGYFIITARTESEALEIAETTPHLKHGGGVTLAALR